MKGMDCSEETVNAHKHTNKQTHTHNYANGTTYTKVLKTGLWTRKT